MYRYSKPFFFSNDLEFWIGVNEHLVVDIPTQIVLTILLSIDYSSRCELKVYIIAYIGRLHKRPDVTIYSTSEKKCVVIELTVPAEENLAQANNRKKCKYADLIHECQEAGWDVRYFPVEVGSRGFTNPNPQSMF